MSACLLSFAATDRPVAAYPDSPQSATAASATPRPGPPRAGQTARILWNFMFDKPAETAPAAPLPVAGADPRPALAAPDRTLLRLGHSTVLMKLRGGFWITDPVFAERASPVQWAGPKPLSPAAHRDGRAAADPGVLLSHDHYDHLDRDAILQLATGPICS